jgi:hypothetical protein
MIIIGASIDLSKIDKGKIVLGKNGAKYYNFDVIVKDTEDKYGNNVQICEKQTKEERTAKEARKFLGNGKTVWKGEGNKKQTPDGQIPDNGEPLF